MAALKASRLSRNSMVGEKKRNTKAAHCFEMTTVTNTSPCNVANVICVLDD